MPYYFFYFFILHASKESVCLAQNKGSGTGTRVPAILQYLLNEYWYQQVLIFQYCAIQQYMAIACYNRDNRMPTFPLFSPNQLFRLITIAILYRRTFWSCMAILQQLVGHTDTRVARVARRVLIFNTGSNLLEYNIVLQQHATGTRVLCEQV